MKAPDPQQNTPNETPWPLVARALSVWDGARDPEWLWPQTPPSPWLVLMATMMLQQTTIATVRPYLRRFHTLFPSPVLMAETTCDTVVALWSGLGYYARARNLWATAGLLRDGYDGAVPADYQALLRLPGVGPYVAGCVLAIGYDLPQPALDVHGYRIMARLTGDNGALTAAFTKHRLNEAASALLHHASPRRLTEVLMDLGGMVCTPSQPECPRCPIRDWCIACQDGLTGVIPPGVTRTASEPVAEACAVVRSGTRLLVRRRDTSPLLHSWEMPSVRLNAGEAAEQGAIRALGALALMGEAGRPLKEIRYTVTRYRVTLTPVVCTVTGEPAGDVRWVGRDDLASLPMGSAMRRLAQRLLADGE